MNGQTLPRPSAGRARRLFSGAAMISLIAMPTSYSGPVQAQSRIGPVSTSVDTPVGWVERPPLHLARGRARHRRHGGRTYSGDGRLRSSKPAAFDSVEARRTGDGTWRDLAPMPTARTNPAAAVLGGKVYVAGGVTNDDVDTDVVEVYDPRTGRWSTSTRMPFPRSAGAAASLGGLLYVAGGGSGEEILDSVVAYDPSSRRWRSVAPMPTARWALRLVASKGHLYAIGGRIQEEESSLATVERYDPKTNAWIAMAPMNQQRAVPGSRHRRRANPITSSSSLPVAQSSAAWWVHSGKRPRSTT